MEKENRSIKIGISSCLLGQKIRFDGGHKRDRYVTDILGEYFRFVPVCPELEIGMGVPREAVRLKGDPADPHMVGSRTGEDWTARMNRYARKRVRQADLADLSGYILKNRSPSCGMERVKVYGKTGQPRRDGVGLYASALLAQQPNLPIEEEGRLTDPVLRENFIIRVFAYNRWQGLAEQPFSRRRIVEFHTAHKFLLLAHHPGLYRQLGQLTADIKKYSGAEFRREYLALFMEALKFKATPKKNVNVLQHIAGFLKKQATAFEKRDLQTAIDDYHRELVPLIVPITLIRHFIEKYDVAYIKNQVYLSPHPKELMLRNHV